MTVLIYVDTSKQVGDKDHLKVFANEDAMEHGLPNTILKAWRSSMRFWSDRRVFVGQPDGSSAIRWRISIHLSKATPISSRRLQRSRHFATVRKPLNVT